MLLHEPSPGHWICGFECSKYLKHGVGGRSKYNTFYILPCFRPHALLFVTDLLLWEMTSPEIGDLEDGMSSNWITSSIAPGPRRTVGRTKPSTRPGSVDSFDDVRGIHGIPAAATPANTSGSAVSVVFFALLVDLRVVPLPFKKKKKKIQFVLTVIFSSLGCDSNYLMIH